jgi:hypothetical protein
VGHGNIQLGITREINGKREETEAEFFRISCIPPGVRIWYLETADVVLLLYQLVPFFNVDRPAKDLECVE